MAIHRPVAPFPGDEETLRRHLAGAEVPALLMTLAHLTGDTSLLRDDLRAPGWLFAPQGGLSEERQAEVRERAVQVLLRLGDPDPGTPPGPPDRELLRTITTWAMGDGTEDLLPLLAEEVVLPGLDPRAPDWTLDELGPGRDFHVAVIGAGFSGLLAGHRLAQAGIPFVIYDKNPDVGGTWLENTYPGCRTDVASHLYNYSFAPKADWPDHFCTQDVVLDYLRTFAKQAGLTDHLRFGTEVTALRWDETAARWHLTLRGPEGARTVSHHAVISAVGQLNRPLLPDLPGRDTFAGPAFHSAAWDHSVDLTGRRVAVVGTGASAYQIVPEIAGTASEVVVFMRNPPWLRPTPHYRRPMPAGARWLCEHLPYYDRWYRLWLLAPGLRGILEGWIVDPGHPPTERAVSALNEELRSSLLASMAAQLPDAPELLDAVTPGYPVGAKRVLRDDGRWLATLQRDDVRLVTAPIDRVTPTGLTAGGVEHDADVLVHATGFQASRFLTPMTVTGRDGADLHTSWHGDPRAYLGITVPGFPNLFCLYGPNTNLVGQGGSIVYFSECAVTHVLGVLRMLLAGGHRSAEVRPETHDAYNRWVDAGNRQRAWGWSAVGGWYHANGRSATNWPYSAQEYWRLTRTADPADYVLRRP
ncbi:NAD(P)/FAD-dependent oxidoreductase [Streptomyces platensis]|uniref:flavin-containing monooxygenase n=1 Tax=Streptomyces platensis TaxID=58346 RepID=UPI002E800091|nr:NAD(P)/FAD-dependent oxidoreductase [Streptomyces platensis]WTI51893.1 NAD(P)/FAD-dependent oxidoreductase [Streptomyces platensis]WUB82549.1 NAD(P)/FAD-dependent oxidoreductase [Streptomyces platensis]